MDMVNRLIQIAKGISLSLGETCEAVVHDGDHRIAYIANGHISGREQGQEMEESVFKYFEDETRANNGGAPDPEEQRRAAQVHHHDVL